jgi:hypothetical protein
MDCSSFENNSRVFYFVCLMKYLLANANPSNHLGSKLEGLFKKYPNVPIQLMRIPSEGMGTMLEWWEEPIWVTEKRT